MVKSMHVDVSRPREMVLTRQFDAPRDLVWRCWTDPAHLAAWWGPEGFTNRCDLDVRPGGQQNITMIGPDGTEYPIKATYLEIVDGEKLVGTATTEDYGDDWHKLFADYTNGVSDGTLRLVQTVSFADSDNGGTLVTVTQTFPSSEERDANMKMGAEGGWGQSFVKLDALLTQLGT